MKRIFAVFSSVAVILLSAGNAVASAQTSDAVVTISDNRIDARASDGSTQVSTADPVGSDAVLSSGGTHSIVGEVLTGDSIQLLLTLTSKNSQKEFRFSIPGSCILQQITLGATSIYRVANCENETLVWLGAPWAKDANGEDVPTSFAFSGGVLTQVVDSSSGDFAYPIVADPYLGLNLVSNVIYTYPGNHPEPNLSVAVTPWLGSVYGASVASPWTAGLGYQVAVDYGWPEVKSQLGAKYGTYALNYVNSHATYNDQYRCHALGAPLIFVSTVAGFDTHPTWDFEGYRAANNNLATWISTRCNW